MRAWTIGPPLTGCSGVKLMFGRRPSRVCAAVRGRVVSSFWRHDHERRHPPQGSSFKVASTAKVVAGGTRRSNLAELAAQGLGRLREVVESFEMGGCDACTADGQSLIFLKMP